jgi:hypothetical protein
MFKLPEDKLVIFVFVVSPLLACLLAWIVLRLVSGA